MTSLVLSNRQAAPDEETSSSHLQTLPGGLEALVGPISGDAAWALDQEIAGVGACFPAADADLLVDCGRLQPGAPGQRELLRTADRVLMVTKADLSGLAHVLGAVQKLRALGDDRVNLITVGDGDFGSRETTAALSVTLLGNVPKDAEGAAMACGAAGRERAFARSPLIETARHLALTLLTPSGRSHDAKPVATEDISVAARSRIPSFFEMGSRRKSGPVERDSRVRRGVVE